MTLPGDPPSDLRVRKLPAEYLANGADFIGSAEAMDKAIQNGDDPVLRFRRSLLFPKLANSRGEIDFSHHSAEEHLRTLISEEISIPNIAEKVNRTAFVLAYHHQNGRTLQSLFAQAYLATDPSLATVSKMATKRQYRRKPRVGITVSFPRNHVVTRSLEVLLRHIDLSKIEPVLISLGECPFSVLDVEVLCISSKLDQARQEIAGLDLDILLYSEIGMNAVMYYLAFSRLARIQAVINGYGLTTGIPNIDFFLTWTCWEPENPELHYTERPIELTVPTYFFEPRNVELTENFRERLGVAKHAKIYLCNHAIYKYHPDMDECISKILDEDPYGVIVIIYDPLDPWWGVLWNRWMNCIPDFASRVHCISRLKKKNYYSLICEADVILDSFPHSSGSTAFENICAGAPTVTLASEFMRGRITAGLYKEMGVNDLTVHTKEEFVHLAVQTANDRTCQQSLKKKILETRERIVATPNSVSKFSASLSDLIEMHNHQP